MPTASLMPVPKLQFFGNDGKPLVGGLLYTAMPGTSAGPGQTQPKATYTDSTSSVENSNPVVLDSAGRADVWILGFYKMALYDAIGNLIWTVDNVSSVDNNNVPSSTVQIVTVEAPDEQVIVTLPVAGGEFIYLRTDETEFPVTLVPGDGTQTIDFGSSMDLTLKGESVHILYNGNNWYRL